VNLQNIPRSDKVVKRAIVPRLGALSFFDYSAIEPRLFAYYAAEMGFPEMAEMVRAGIDPYTAVAALIEQKEDITPEERQHWKVFFLSLMYGGGLRTIMAQFNCNTKQARSMVNQFHENFPAVRSIQDTVARVSAQRGYILGIDGRHLHPEPHGEHKMLNKLIQGGAAGIMKQATLRVHNWLVENDHDLQSRIISIVHDELQIDGPTDDVGELHRQVPALMIHEKVNAVVPIEVDHEVSTTNWAEKIPYDEWRQSA
jgi:DNA polymerase I-like protein with 3'-5' exonuclease and polymerase domains